MTYDEPGLEYRIEPMADNPDGLSAVNFLDRLAEVTRRNPAAVAIDAHDEVWTYAELVGNAEQLAARLTEAGVRAGDVVALRIGRSAWHIAAMLAAWQVRAAFLPIEPGIPRTREAAILTESCARVLVSSEGDRLRGTESSVDRRPSRSRDAASLSAESDGERPHGEEGGGRWFAAAHGDSQPPAEAEGGGQRFGAGGRRRFTGVGGDESLCAEAGGAGLGSAAARGVEPQVEPHIPLRISRSIADLPPLAAAADDLAYVIYTSGSTGRPKGVRVAHTGLVPMLTAQIDLFALAPGMRALFTLSTAFDASISDIGTALLAGATLVIPSEPATPTTLAELVRAHGITHADLPPSLLAHVDPDSVPNTLRTIVIGGEVCAPGVVRAWAARVRLINVYGPTEATICTSMSRCGPDWSRPLIGSPLPHVEYALHDGELLIGGPALALGYIDRPELDRERFITRAGRRWYRTGDLVRHHPNGDWEFVGRKDRQVKINGRLVCPEEIEARLRDVPGITEAAVTVTDSPTTLIAHVRADDAALTPGAIHDRLALSLPAWMLPRITLVEALSRNRTGKVDHHALAAGLHTIALPDRPDAGERPSSSRPESQRARTSPDPRRVLLDRRTELICRAFEAALGLADVAPDDDFRQLGGDSLAALIVVTEARLRGVALLPAAVLTDRTPARLAAAPRPADRTVADMNQVVTGSIGLAVRPAHTPTTRSEAVSAVPVGDWLITGATGFLGRHLVPELLRRTTGTVHCLVRARDPEHARHRLGALARHPRVAVHAGDVASPDLGLSPDLWRSLSTDIGGIIHGAAALSLSLPFTDMAAVNIRGAAEIARFAGASGAKVFHLSSLAVLAATDLEAETLDERTRLTPSTRLFGCYPQTKWAAETLLRASVPRLFVIRPGLLTGDSATGEGPANCPLTTFLRAVSTLGCLPEADRDLLRVNITPVDHAATAIAELATSPCPPTVHVASETGASLRDLRDALGTRATIRTVSQAEFAARTRRHLTRADALAMVTASYRLTGTDEHRDADLFLNTARRFPCDLLHATLGRTIAPPTPELLARYVEFALRSSGTAQWSA
ncbi:AMP-binding protein [Nocardia sp. NPDC005978]|uniref:non-ribosomal peptide synthetase n=1 Tax=Nocardia sp. NPDC005978 TaxID=3156725 RepID=UPI0033AED764